MAEHHDFKVKNGLVVNDSGTFGNHITGTSASFTGDVIAANITSTGNVIADNILDSDQVIAIVAANETPQDFAYSSLTGAPNVLDSASVNQLIDSDYIQIRTAAGTDSATVSAIIDSDITTDYIFARTKIKSSSNYYIQTAEPTILNVGEYWYKSDSDILYKSIPATALTTTIPSGNVNGSPYAGKLINWVANNPSSVTRTDISGTDALGGTFTAGTNADAWFFFTLSLSPPNLNGGMYFDFDSDVDIRGIVIEQNDPNAGRLAEIKYRNGDYADNNNGGTLTWYNSGGSALGKSVTPNGNTFVDISHPTGELAYRIGFEQIGDYYSGNDVFLFFAGGREWEEIDRSRTDAEIAALGLDSDEVINLIDSDYINARVAAGTDSASVINLIDSAYVLARTGTIGLDSAAVLSIALSGYGERKTFIQSSAPTSDFQQGDFWWDRDGNTLYKATASTSYTSYPLPAGSTSQYPGLALDARGNHLTKQPGYTSANFTLSGAGTQSYPNTGVFATHGGTYPWEPFDASNTGVKYTLTTPTTFYAFYNGNTASGWIYKIEYEDGSYAISNNASPIVEPTSLSWFDAAGNSLNKTTSFGNGLRILTHPTGAKCSAFVVARGSYGTRNYDFYIFFSGADYWKPVGDMYLDSDAVRSYVTADHVNSLGITAGLDSDAVIELIDSDYVNARVATSNFDSDAVIAIIDSDYVNARVEDGIDSSTVSSIITDDVDKAFVDALNIDADLLDGANGTYYLNYSNFTNTPTILNAASVRALFNTEIETESVTKLDHLSYLHDSDASIFTVTVDAKTDDHRYSGQGSSSAYTVNGDESPFLVLQPGQSYTFDQSDATNSGHPILFYYDAGKTNQYTNGVTSVGTAGNAGASVTLEVTDNTPSVLFYQCQNHGYMGNALFTQTRNLTGFTTTDVSEGNNLYYTQSRVDSRIQSIVNQAYIEARVSALDSAAADAIFLTQDEAITLIDSAYVNARSTAIEPGIDSAAAITLIETTVDSAYVIARQQQATPADGLDSNTVISLIDSAYIQARQTTVSSGGSSGAGGGSGFAIEKYQYIATASQTVFTGADDNSETLAYDPTSNQINVYLNGVLLIDSDDFTQTDSSTLTLIDSATLNDRITIVKFEEPPLIDSAYVQARQSGVDSAAILDLIDSDYVTARQSVLQRGTLEINKFYYISSENQTIYNGIDEDGNNLSINPNNIEVYLNGILLIKDTDYTATTSQITLVDPSDLGYSLYVIETIGRVNSPNTNVATQTSLSYVADSGQTLFSGNDDNGTPFNNINFSGAIDVHLNGLLISRGDDYTISNAGLILLDAADSGDFLSINNIFGTAIAPTVKIYEFEADSGQTLFSGSGLAYANGAIQVHLNGIMLQPSVDYIANNGTSITLTNPADSADELFVSAFSNPGLALTTFTFIGDSAQTVFTGLDRDSASFTYNTTDNQVFINGILIDNANDYTATSSTILTLTQGTNAGDEVKIMSYDQTSATIIKNDLRDWKETPVTPYQAVAGDRLFLDVSSSPKTVTLPSSATMGDEIRIIDATGNSATNNITVARNAHNIVGSATDLIINTDRAGIGLVYYNATQGWILIEN